MVTRMVSESEWVMQKVILEGRLKAPSLGQPQGLGAGTHTRPLSLWLGGMCRYSQAPVPRT